MEDSISTISSQRPLEEYSHLFDSPKREASAAGATAEATAEAGGKMASPPMFSNIVLKTCHDANIDLNILFHILPIVNISPQEIKDLGKKFNEIFISVRKYPKSRGYRGPSSIKSFLDMDFYFMDRNFHLKVSTNKISIVGGGSIEISKCLIETIYHHLIALHNKWISFKDMSHEKREEISKLFEQGTPPEDPSDLDFYEVLESIIDRDNEDVKERLCDLNPLIGLPLYEKDPVFTKLVNCNSVHNYYLPEEISLVEAANKLFHKGYTVRYHNFIVVKCFKAYWTDPETGNLFRFSIQNIGTIKQNSSSTTEESIAMYEKIVKDLGYMPYEKGKDFVTKAKARSSEVVVKNDKCLAILDRYLRAP